MSKNNKNGTKVDVAVIKNDLNWIKDKLINIEDAVTTTKACVDTHENRILKLEDTEGFKENTFKNKILKWGIILSAISAIISVILFFVDKLLW